jgi:hypothetical protein
MALRRLAIATALIATAVTSLPAPAGATTGSAERLLAHGILHPGTGGYVTALNGAQLYVPPNALSDDSLVTITRLRGGRYDFHINQPWTGSVRVTLPRKRNATYVMHRVSGLWVREGERGRRRAWVEHLSVFSWLIDKLRLKACLTRDPATFLLCVKKKGIAKLTGPLVEWFLDIIPNDFSAECKEELKSSTAPEILYQILLGSKCMPSVGDPQPPLEPEPQPQPDPQPEPEPQPQPAALTWAEQQGSLGANTFTNPYNASGIGIKIAPMQWVQVSCKVYAPQIVSANPDGYWYRIASAPWNNAYYAVANTFWNGDVPGQKPYTHNTDFAVPNC